MDGGSRRVKVQPISNSLASKIPKKIAATSDLKSGGSRVIFRWKNSLYKLVYKELILFYAIFIGLKLTYQYVLEEDGQSLFRSIGKLCKDYGELISLPFLVGFYLTIIANRWWQQYLLIPWPDRLFNSVSMYIPGNDEYTKLVKQVLMRRSLLMLVLLLRSVSIAVENRFKTIQDVVDIGLMTATEKRYFERVTADINLFWVPGGWFISAFQDAVTSGAVADSCGTKLIMEEFLDFRMKCGVLWCYDWVSIPMVYTQVVSLAVYTVFLCYLFSRQFQCVSTGVELVSGYFPVWTLFEFMFYMGLLKIAEIMKDPFGDDEGDFDLNFLISRHLKVLQLSMEDLHDFCPPMKEENLDTGSQLIKILPVQTFETKRF